MNIFSTNMDEPMMDDLKILELSCSIYIVRYLNRHPGLNKSQIMSTEGRALSTKNRRIDQLYIAGLIDSDIREEEGMRKGEYFKLTDMGKEVADHLDAIYEIMKDHLAGCNEDFTSYTNPHAKEILAQFRDDNLDNKRE